MSEPLYFLFFKHENTLSFCCLETSSSQGLVLLPTSLQTPQWRTSGRGARAVELVRENAEPLEGVKSELDESGFKTQGSLKGRGICSNAA